MEQQAVRELAEASTGKFKTRSLSSKSQTIHKGERAGPIDQPNEACHRGSLSLARIRRLPGNAVPDQGIVSSPCLHALPDLL